MRLIDADVLDKSIRDWYCAPERCDNYNGVRCRACSIDDALSELDSAPTIDAEPVRHGRWVRDTVDTPDIWFCTACKYCIAWRPNYCPNCGAKMDGGKNNAEQ